MCSSGVFLAAGLVHMLPDASEDLSDLDTTLPVAFVVAGLGFCLLLSIEQNTEQHRQEAPVTTETISPRCFVSKGLDASQEYLAFEDQADVDDDSNWVSALVLRAALSAHSLLAGAFAQLWGAICP